MNTKRRGGQIHAAHPDLEQVVTVKRRFVANRVDSVLVVGQVQFGRSSRRQTLRERLRKERTIPFELGGCESQSASKLVLTKLCENNYPNRCEDSTNTGRLAGVHYEFVYSIYISEFLVRTNNFDLFVVNDFLVSISTLNFRGLRQFELAGLILKKTS